jgi:hypothetical protein
MPGAPPAKKSNALMWVGLGCGGLFLLSAIGGGIAVYMAKKATENALASASSAFGAPLTAPGATATPGSGTDSSGAPVSGACAKAVECCRKIIQKTSPGAQNEAGCLALKQLPEANCQLPLTTYQKSATLLGLTCD